MTLAELRARVARAAPAQLPSDPVAFARIIGIEPDEWQCRVLRSSRKMILNCSRQAGKSTISSVKAVHTALYKPNSLTLLISPSLRQSAELFRKVADTLSKVPDAPSRTEDNKLSLALSNGSRIVSLPSSESTIRGFSAVTLIIEDEAAFVDDEIFTAVRPMLAVSNGQLMLLSTPNGRKGHFFKSWSTGGDGWERVEIPARDIPRISAEFLAEERRDMGDARYRQEYQCEFVHAATGLVYSRFDPLVNVVQPSAKRLDNHILSIAYGFTDTTAFAVLGWNNHDQVARVVKCFKFDGTPSEAAYVARHLVTDYAPIAIIGDTDQLGKDYVDEARERFDLPIEAADREGKRGYIDLLNDALAGKRLVLTAGTCEQLIEEWINIPWHESREREMAGYDNFCANATLYGWRSCWAFLENPAEHKPAKGSPEAIAAWLAEDEERLAQDEDRIVKPTSWARRMANNAGR